MDLMDLSSEGDSDSDSSNLSIEEPPTAGGEVRRARGDAPAPEPVPQNFREARTVRARIDWASDTGDNDDGNGEGVRLEVSYIDAI